MSNIKTSFSTSQKSYFKKSPVPLLNKHSNFNRAFVEKKEELYTLKEDVGSLEKWFNDQKVKNSSQMGDKNYLNEAKDQIMRQRLDREHEKLCTSDEPILNQNLVNFSVFDQNLNNFLEDQKNIEKMKEFSRKKKNSYNLKKKSSSIKKYEPIKSQDTIKNEFRRQILSQIILDKLIKRKKEADKSGVSLTTYNEATNWTYEGAMPLFKCLHQNKFSNNDNLIEMDFLREKISEFQQPHKKHFELGILEEQFNKMTNDLKSLEEILLQKYNQISKEIAKRKGMGSNFRNIHSNLTLTEKRLYEEKDVLLGKFNSVEQKLLSSLSEKNELQSKGKSKNHLDFMKLEVNLIFLFFLKF